MSTWMRSRLSRICWIFLVSGPHCRLIAAEQDEEVVLLATRPLRCHLLPVDLGLLVGGRFLELANLFGAGCVVAAAVEGLKLGLEPRAERILLRLRRRRLQRLLLLRMGRQQRRENHGGRRERAAPSEIHRIPHSPLGLQRPSNRTLNRQWCPKFGRRNADSVKIRRFGPSPCWPRPANGIAAIRPTGSTARRR